MGRREAYPRFWWGNLKVRDNLGDLGADWRRILRCIFRKWDVELAQDKDRWRALVKAVMNLRVPLNVDNFLTENRLASQEGLCCME
jgi:hypothetical protein